MKRILLLLIFSLTQAAFADGDRRMVVFGVDGMDPEMLRQFIADGDLPNLKRLTEEGSFKPLATSVPPQSPVAWSNFITGLNPGGHGIFDFIHRNPMSRSLASCTTTDVTTAFSIPLPGKWKIDYPSGGDSNRSGRAFWQMLMDEGIPADIWRMPANFPVEEADGLSFSGMLTPAVDSAYGQNSFFTTDPMRSAAVDYSKAVLVREYDGVIDTSLQGPANGFREDGEIQTAPLTVFIDRDAGAAAFDLDGEVVILEPGEWSDFVGVTFYALPMNQSSTSGICRFYLRSIEPEVEFYVSPVNIDPENPMAPVSAPDDASAELAEAIGPYYTQGMAEDVNALKYGVLDDAEFMQQVELVYRERRTMFDEALERYATSDGGFLFFYFSTVDLSCHMMWRHHDASHPAHDPEVASQDASGWSGRPGSTWKDTVHELYVKMDPVLGQIRERLGDDVPLIVMSDHGFAPYKRKFSLNTWLVKNGYLVLKPDKTPETKKDPARHEQVHIFDGSVDWSKTRAYGMGFNGLYLNRAGRELDNPKTEEDESGIVTDAEVDALLAEIKAKLEAEVDDVTGMKPVLRCDLAMDVYSGERLAEAPDIMVSYNAGYGNSDPASTGRIPMNILEDNTGGTFNGSHLMAPEVVSGILLTNQSVLPGEHALTDLTVEILDYFGVEPPENLRGHPVID